MFWGRNYLFAFLDCSSRRKKKSWHVKAQQRIQLFDKAQQLFDLTQENVESYEKGTITPTNVDISIGSEKYYSLSNNFHERSKKRSCEHAFRSLNLCSNLKINSSVAEQQNAVMSRDRYGEFISYGAMPRNKILRALKNACFVISVEFFL